MKSRERFLKTINREIPDRPPVFATFTPQVAQKMSKRLNVPYEKPLDSLLSTRISHTNLLLNLGNDAIGIAACSPKSTPSKTSKEGVITNEWGMMLKNVGLYNEFIDFPLKDAESLKDIEDYNFPDPMAEGRFDQAKMAIAKYGKDYGIIADLETSIFETAWYLTGMEKMLLDLLIQPAYLEALLDKIMHINTEIGKELIRLGADMIWAGDDFGSQDSLIMDTLTWRQLFKPRINKMFEEFRRVNPDIKIAWHSCGAVTELIPDFIDIGLDILNPIQPMAKGMEPKWLKDTYGKDLTFFGGICVQDLLPNGSPQQIKDEVKRRAEIMGKDGGFIIAPAHNIQDDTPEENVLAFFETVKGL